MPPRPMPHRPLHVQGVNFNQNSRVFLGGLELGGVVVNASGTMLLANIAGT